MTFSVFSPNFAAAWMNLGITQATLKQYEVAETSYKTALMKRHNYPDCYYNLGNMVRFSWFARFFFAFVG